MKKETKQKNKEEIYCSPVLKGKSSRKTATEIKLTQKPNKKEKWEEELSQLISLSVNGFISMRKGKDGEEYIREIEILEMKIHLWKRTTEFIKQTLTHQHQAILKEKTIKKVAKAIKNAEKEWDDYDEGFKDGKKDILKEVEGMKQKVPKSHKGKSWCPQCEDKGYNQALDDLTKLINEKQSKKK